MKYAVDLYFDHFCPNSDSCCGVCYKDRSMDYSKMILIREIFTKNVPCLRNTRRTIRLMKLQEIETIIEERCLFQTYEVCPKNVSQELLV